MIQNSNYIESNEIAAKTISSLQLIVNKHAPRKLISQGKQKQLNKPWTTNATLQSTNKSDIAEQFNKYFISAGPSLASTIDHYDEEPSKYINKSPVSCSVMSPVEATQVCRLFQNLNENKTSLDIPNKLIQIASEPLCPLHISTTNLLLTV